MGPYRTPEAPRVHTYEEIMEACERVAEAGGGTVWVTPDEFDLFVKRVVGNVVHYPPADPPSVRAHPSYDKRIEYGMGWVTVKCGAGRVSLRVRPY